MVTLLVLCTANLCRSPMGAAFLGARLHGRGIPAQVRSAGIVADERPVPPEVVRTMAGWGIDLSAHRSRQLAADELGCADLVIGMARAHVREAVVLNPAVRARAFTLKELVRLGTATGSRSADETLSRWLDRVGSGRDRRSLFGRSDDDVRDPIGGSPAGYDATASELSGLVTRLVDLAWPADGPFDEASRARCLEPL